ncbi:hypothetical protein HPB47_006856 [Ixodes persulcatus]|uniref:Uncharacterized protein n=1 Tax=Ixodes persulcatus TaxID=34615 RepID=A0AC60P984_IXOPE|nr:hypothetical protein HPB47_006856 [Ixodes persulcatus]
MSEHFKESGVDLHFDEMMAASSLSLHESNGASPYSFYEVKNRTVVPSLPPPQASAAMKGGRPPLPLSRTNLKQQLMRHQMEQEERRQRELQSAMGTPPASSAICVPGIQERMPAEILVPTQVLQVESRLENPTRYHVEQSKKRQVKQFLSSRAQAELGGAQPFSPESPASVPHSGSAATSNSEGPEGDQNSCFGRPRVLVARSPLQALETGLLEPSSPTNLLLDYNGRRRKVTKRNQCGDGGATAMPVKSFSKSSSRKSRSKAAETKPPPLVLEIAPSPVSSLTGEVRVGAVEPAAAAAPARQLCAV